MSINKTSSMFLPLVLLLSLTLAFFTGLAKATVLGPSFTLEPPSVVLFTNYTGAIIDCSARGDPEPIIDWVDKNGNILPLMPSVATRLSNGSLYFPPFSRLPLRSQLGLEMSQNQQRHHHHLVDMSNYDYEFQIRCRASNAYGRIVSRLSRIRPVLDDSPGRVIVRGDPVEKYNRAVLHCQSPPISYLGRINAERFAHVAEVISWTRGDIELFPSVRGDGKFHVVPSTGDLHVLRADYADTLVSYTCKVRNTITGEIEHSQPFSLVVNDSGIPTKPVQMSHQELFYSVDKDDSAVMTCNVQSNPPPAFSWFRVTNNLLEPIARSSRIHLSGGILVIEGVQPDEDSGQYRCTARNERGEVSLTMNLEVITEIAVDVVPSEQIIDIGRQARIECLTEDRDRDSISWRKDGKELRRHDRVVVLQIFNLQNDDYGMYQCFVHRGPNREAQASSELRLGDASPRFTYRFIDQTLQPGPLVSLKCSARGSPTPVIEWALNGFPLPDTERFLLGQYVTSHGDVVSHVNISRVDVKDGGFYTCNVKNRAGEIQHGARLNVYGPPFVHPLGELKAVMGKPFSVMCPAAGYPIEKIIWKNSAGKEFPLDSRHRVFHNGTLFIEKVVRKDAGEIECSATNRQGTTATQRGVLKVIVPPTLSKFNVGSQLRLGQRISMLCSITDGDIPMSLKWYKDSERLSPGRTGAIVITEIGQFESVLRIDRLQPEHNANFTCVAENFAGTASHSQMLMVKVAPLVEAFVFPKNLTVGKRLRVICTVSEGDRPIHVEWIKDGQTVATSAANNNNVHVTRIDEYTSLLAIARLNTEHAGNYSCVATNAVAKFARSAILTIRVPPEWVTRPKDLEAVEGQDVFFPCRVSGVPEPMITWRKLADSHSRHPLLELSLQRPVYNNYRLLMNGTLFIRKVTANEEGKYLCEADNGVNEALGQVVSLKVNAPPKFDVAHAGPVTARTGESMELVCEASGDDHISITWRKDGKDYLTMPGKSSTTEIRELDRVTSKLRIANSEQSDAGRYSCVASNAFGQSHFSIDVTIWEPPPTPGNVSILEISSRSVKVAWTIESASPRVERIAVQWKEQSENWFPDGKQSLLPGLITETVVTGLRPWTIYHLRVFAENQLGKSKEGRVIQFKTNGEKPGGAPRNVRVTALSSTTLEVTWDDPDPKLTHGPIVRYNIGYREFNSQNYKFIDVDKFEHDVPGSNFLLRRLRKHCEYEVVIQVINIYGEGPLSRPSIGTTLEDVPSGPPEKVHCVALTSTTIQVSWHPPVSHLRNGVIMGYKVLYAPHPGPKPVARLPVPKIARVSTVTTVLENLRKFSNYTIQVLAYTSAGDGVFSQLVTCATLTDVPGPPAVVKASSASRSSVVVSWLEPEEANGVIQKYHVYVRPLRHDGQSHTKYTRGADIFWIDIDDLDQSEQYQFWVTAVTHVGEGMSSNVVTGIPQDHVPARAVSLSKVVYIPLRSELELHCRAVGLERANDGKRHWLFNGEEQDPSLTEQIDDGKDQVLRVASVTRKHDGNFTCHVENQFGQDSIAYETNIQVPPSSPRVHIIQTSPHSITLRWEVVSDGMSPVTTTMISYKMTYGEWESEEVGWHRSEFTLTNLSCGREYHLYVVLVNALGSSPTSEVLTVRTMGEVPSAPSAEDFFVANTTFFILKLNLFNDRSCEIQYFVIEYRLLGTDVWTTVTNDLLPQPRYTIRGLLPDTDYQLKVTAHNQAGSTVAEFDAHTLPENYSGAAPYGNDSGFHHVIMGLGLKTILLIVVSSLCLFLSSLGVCICLKKRRRPRGHSLISYGEMPKSCTMENRQNAIEHQLYATIQRQKPPVPPFNNSKGFETMKRNATMTTTSTTCDDATMNGHHHQHQPSNVHMNSVQSNPDILPYATTTQYQFSGPGNLQHTMRCNTLGRLKNLEMSEYQKQKLIDEANTVRIRESKEYTLSLGRNQKLQRRPFSEAEEYEADNAGHFNHQAQQQPRAHPMHNIGPSQRPEGPPQHHQGGGPINGLSATSMPTPPQMRPALNAYRFRQQFHL